MDNWKFYTMLCYTMHSTPWYSIHAIYIILSYTMLCYIILFCTILHYAILYHVVLVHTMLYYMLCYVMLHYAILFYTIPCYVIHCFALSRLQAINQSNLPGYHCIIWSLLIRINCFEMQACTCLVQLLPTSIEISEERFRKSCPKPRSYAASISKPNILLGTFNFLGSLFLALSMLWWSEAQHSCW